MTQRRLGPWGPRIAIHGLRGWASVGVISLVSVGGLFAVGGCHSDCEAPVGDFETPVSEAVLSATWTDAAGGSATVVVANGPYRVSDASVDLLVEVFRDQAGIDLTVVEGGDTGLGDTGILPWRDVSRAGAALAPPNGGLVLVIMSVSDTDFPTATFGFLDFWNTSVAVMVIHRDAARIRAVGPVTPEVIETLTVLHEAGHWLGVPARDHHVSSVDNTHCTNARCVMFSGSRLSGCGILVNLVTGIPSGFGPECAEELEEMRRRRSEP